MGKSSPRSLDVSSQITTLVPEPYGPLMEAEVALKIMLLLHL